MTLHNDCITCKQIKVPATDGATSHDEINVKVVAKFERQNSSCIDRNYRCQGQPNLQGYMEYLFYGYGKSFENDVRNINRN